MARAPAAVLDVRRFDKSQRAVVVRKRAAACATKIDSKSPESIDPTSRPNGTKNWPTHMMPGACRPSADSIDGIQAAGS